MPKVRTKLRELRNAEVAYISLVDRAATRIPFRIMKRDKEKQMINLSGLGKVLKGTAQKTEATGPTVSAIVVQDHADEKYMESVRKSLTDNGFVVDKATKNDDGTVTFAQTEDPLADAALVRVSDQMVVAVKGFDPYSEELSDNADFNDMVAASGFFNGMMTAFDGLSGTLSSILSTASSPDDAAKKADDTLTKFSSYVKALIEGLPSAAFKADTALRALAAKADNSKVDLNSIPDEAPEGITQNDWDDLSDDEKLAWIKDSVAKTDNNTVMQIAELLKTPPQGSDGTEWAAMSMGDKLNWVLASYNTSNPSGAQEDGQPKGSAADFDGTVQIGVTSPTSKADSISSTEPTTKNVNRRLTAADCPDGTDPKDWENMSPEDKQAAVDAAKNADAKKVAEKLDALAKKTDETVASFSTLLANVSALSESVATLATKMGEQDAKITSRIDEIARKSEDALTKVAGVVIAPPASGDNPAQGGPEPAKKQDTDPRTGAFDTAFLRKRNR